MCASKLVDCPCSTCGQSADDSRRSVDRVRGQLHHRYASTDGRIHNRQGIADSVAQGTGRDLVQWNAHPRSVRYHLSDLGCPHIKVPIDDALTESQSSYLLGTRVSHVEFESVVPEGGNTASLCVQLGDTSDVKRDSHGQPRGRTH